MTVVGKRTRQARQRYVIGINGRWTYFAEIAGVFRPADNETAEEYIRKFMIPWPTITTLLMRVSLL